MRRPNYFVTLAIVTLAVSSMSEVKIPGTPPPGPNRFDTAIYAGSTVDEELGRSAIFPPIPSCLSNVILVIFVEYLGMLENLQLYKNMYASFFAAIEFYVDGTWCDPYVQENPMLPCFGQPLNRSSLPSEVRIIDKMGGGWLMQKALFDSIQRHSNDNIQGFFFAADDLLLNMGQFSRIAKSSQCNAIMRSSPRYWADLYKGESTAKISPVWIEYIERARRFYAISDVKFRNQLEQNLGGEARFVTTQQSDFVYLPSWVIPEWLPVAQQMTNEGLGFQYTFSAALFGVARMEDMLVVNTRHLMDSRNSDISTRRQRHNLRPSEALATSTYREYNGTTCWIPPIGGKESLLEWGEFVLQQHIIHPVKLSHKTSRNFAFTVNAPRWSSTGTFYAENAKPAQFWCQSAS